ncbi:MULTISPECIES: baseplate J/gp47 family protein [unclassified Pseudomonas]|uniref:baseplate J/gp47 family protein n=1 Tax=unclassified Pseudomonas TaxID=196821 RepID=UPI00244CC6C5|nr:MULTISPECIES: baseplate J/gp47 family protein [unclassified Pseudomonas]MDH0894691.1 baseplate J/gp47 family protein [Pseudomonas sp. GD03875]MDH1067259.1 baseplate J/gp47 family protein [Pseudomonas sp. GD03985]
MTLNAPDIVEALDYERILQARKEGLLAQYPEADRQAVADVLALESEPLTKLLQESAYRELLLRARINDAARANLIIYATGLDLDHIGELFGLPRLAGEQDPRYRERLLLRIAAMAGNGTREHYVLVALSASLAVRSAEVIQPAAGRVDVVLWLHEGADGPATLAACWAAFDAPGAKMLGVTLGVRLALAKPVDVLAGIWREATAPTNLVAQLATSFRAQFAAQATLGRPIARSWITSALHAAGVAKVELNMPADIAIGADEFATLRSLQLTDRGLA